MSHAILSGNRRGLHQPLPAWRCFLPQTDPSYLHVNDQSWGGIKAEGGVSGELRITFLCACRDVGWYQSLRSLANFSAAMSNCCDCDLFGLFDLIASGSTTQRPVTWTIVVYTGWWMTGSLNWLKKASLYTPPKFNGWNPKSWRFGSDTFSNGWFSGSILAFQGVIPPGTQPTRVKRSLLSCKDRFFHGKFFENLFRSSDLFLDGFILSPFEGVVGDGWSRRSLGRNTLWWFLSVWTKKDCRVTKGPVFWSDMTRISHGFFKEIGYSTVATVGDLSISWTYLLGVNNTTQKTVYKDMVRGYDSIDRGQLPIFIRP